MDISEFYASHIRRVQVGFVISGEKLDHKKITDTLGIKPDAFARLGDPKILKGKTIGSYSKGFWRVDTKNNIHSKDINDHLNYLLSILLPHKNTIIELAQDGEIFFDVLWESTYLYAGTGPLIEKDCLYGMGQLHASIGFDIYQINEESDE